MDKLYHLSGYANTCLAGPAPLSLEITGRTIRFIFLTADTTDTCIYITRSDEASYLLRKEINQLSETIIEYKPAITSMYRNIEVIIL